MTIELGYSPVTQGAPTTEADNRRQLERQAIEVAALRERLASQPVEITPKQVTPAEQAWGNGC